MDKVIKWLFQRTADGATYLQVIIIGIIFIWLINMFFRTVEDIEKSMKEDDK